MRTLLVLALFTPALVAAPVPKADPKKSWVGQTVVMRTNDTLMSVKSGGETEQVRVNVLNPVVLSETDDAIEIYASGKTGTVSKADVVRADEEGTAFFTKQIDAQPSVDLYLRRASVLKARGMLDEALGDHDKAIQASPSSAGYNNRGQLHAAKRDYPAALADFNKASELDPDSPFPYRGRGQVLEITRKYDDALADYKRANDLDPDAWTHTGAGRVLAAKKEFADAEGEYTAALKLNPKHAPAFLLRAVTRFERKLDKDGDSDLDEAARLLPNDPSVFVSRASAAGRRGRYADATKEVGEALRLNPKHAGALNLRAWALATCPDAEYRDADKAIDAATRACEATQWKAAGYIDTLAAAYAEAGKWEEAVKWQTKALEDPALLANEGTEAKGRLELYQAKKPYREEPKWKR